MIEKFFVFSFLTERIFLIMSNQKTWQLIDVLKEATVYLKSKGIENPRLNAERLMGHALGLSRLDLYLRFEQPLSPQERETYKILLRRRADHEPLQYILGETEFMSLPFKVTPEVLIPRPETEIMVEKAIELIRLIFDHNTIVSVLDIGTGCGNISISLVENLKNLRILAIDKISAAIKISKENAERNNTINCIEFQVLDVMKSDFIERCNQKFNVIVSNPPYVSTSEYKILSDEIRNYEPRIALEAGEDGLIFYHRFFQLLPSMLTKPGLALFEIGETQAYQIKSIFSKNSHLEIQILNDYSHKDRLALIKYH